MNFNGALKTFGDIALFNIYYAPLELDGVGGKQSKTLPFERVKLLGLYNQYFEMYLFSKFNL